MRPPTNREKRRWDANREARQMEALPAPARGIAGEFRPECRKSRDIMRRLRAYLAAVVEARRGGTA